jgi:FkbM family methyltransferase
MANRVVSTALWTTGLDTLKALGFSPRTVFDIGVAAGTQDLYDAFPTAEFFLVDPTRESRPHMERIARRLNARVFNLALGNAEGEQEIEVRLDDIQGATFFKEFGSLGMTERYRVSVKRFDGTFPEFARPALCKIDVQGSELNVLHGIGARIDEIDAFIVEVSTIPTLQDGPDAFDIIAFFKQRRFAIFDLLGATRRPVDNALAQIDLLFVKEDSGLRADRRWRAD